MALFVFVFERIHRFPLDAFLFLQLAIEHLFSRAGVWHAYKVTYLSEMVMVVQMPKMSA